MLALMAMMFDQFRTLPHRLRNVISNAFCGFLTTFRLPTKFQKKAPEAQRFLSTFGVNPIGLRKIEFVDY